MPSRASSLANASAKRRRSSPEARPERRLEGERDGLARQADGGPDARRCARPARGPRARAPRAPRRASRCRAAAPRARVSVRPPRITSSASERPAMRGSLALRPPAPGIRPRLGLGQPEARVLRGQHDVAGQRELAAAAEAPAVHGGDDRQPRRAQPLPSAAPRSPGRAPRPPTGSRMPATSAPAANARPAPHSTTQRTSPDSSTASSAAQSACEHLVRERVQRLGPVQAQQRDGSVTLALDDLAHTPRTMPAE